MGENVNFRGIVNEYVNLKKKQERNGQLQGGSVDFGSVHLHARHVKIPSQVEDSNTRQEVTVQNGQAGPELRTDKLLRNDVEVSIIRGYCHDLQDKEMNFDLSHGFGRVKIRAKEGKQKVSAAKLDVSMSSSCGNGAKAMVQSEQKEIPMSFLTKVYPRGKVLLENGERSWKTQTIIEDLKKKGSAKVAEFNEDDKGFYWLMEGVCLMNVGVKHAHNWSS